MKTVAFAFWQMPDEEEAFLDFLDSTGACVAYPNHWVRTAAEVSASSMRSYLIEHNPTRVKLGLELHAAEVTVEIMEQSKEQLLGTDLMGSCLIGYSRPRFRNGNQLGESNLAAYLDSYREGIARPKPEWFRSWVKKVFSWAKRHAKKGYVHQHYSYPATPLVVKLAEEGQIEPVH